jgi:hypothetical protein
VAELNVALILRLVDRLSAPARAATAAVSRIGGAQSAVGKAAQAATRLIDSASQANGVLSKSADLVSESTAAAARVVTAATASIVALTTAVQADTDAMGASARVSSEIASATARAGNAAAIAARKFGNLERMQFRARAASRMLGGEFGKLNSQLSTLAMGSIVTSGMERAGRGIVDPITRSIERAAEFQKGMTGIGIMGDLTPRQLVPVQANIIASAQRLALPIGAMQQDDMAVLNEGVYRNARDLIAASKSAARLSLLSEISGSPITGAEAGGLIATYAHSMLAPASSLDRLNATLFRASQIGGVRIGNASRFLPEIMGQMKGRAFGNYQGFVDANAALQITKRFTGNDEAAGVYTRDLMQNLNHMLTDRRFAKAGLDLEKVIADGVRNHVSPLVSSINAIISKIGSSASDPGLIGKLGKFFQNAQAATAAAAIITNQRDTAAGPGFNTYTKMIADPSALTAYYGALGTASRGPYADLVRLQNAEQQIGIATGTILFPALNKLAGVMTHIANLVSAVEKRGGFLAKAAIYAASGVGVLALGAGALGNAVVGVVAPIMIARSLFRMMPLATKVAAGGVAKLAERYGFATVATRVLNGGALTLASQGLPAIAIAARAATIALLANPMTWPIVAAAAAVGVAALVIRKYWQPISAFFSGVWRGIGEGLRPVQRQLAGVGRSAAAFFAPIKPVVDAVTSAIKAAWEWIARLIEPVKLTGSQLHNTTEAGRQFGLALVGLGRTVASFMSNLNPLQHGLFAVGAQLVEGLIGGMQSKQGTLHKAIAANANGVATGFKAQLGIHSPSRVFAVIGDQTMAGLDIGLRRSSGRILTHLRAQAGRMAAAMTIASVPLAVAAQGIPQLPAIPTLHAAVERAIIPPPRLPAVPFLHVAASRPTIPQPFLPAVRPLYIPVLQATIRAPRLQAIPNLRVAVDRITIPTPRLPAMPALHLAVDPVVIPPPRLPSISALNVAVSRSQIQLAGVPSARKPTAETLQRIHHTLAAPQLAERPQRPAAREIHHHHTYQMTFKIDGKHDPRQIAREIKRLEGRARDAALHDGFDDV